MDEFIRPAPPSWVDSLERSKALDQMHTKLDFVHEDDTAGDVLPTPTVGVIAEI